MPIPSYVARVLTELEARGFQAFCVGGCVRDCLLGRVPEDWDVTTSALPEQTMALFGQQAVPTGLRHGTVTVVSGGKGVEVTTFRVDGAYGDNRHPDSVTFTRSLPEDLARRDFTVNAMAMDLRGRIQDPWGGQADLERRCLRCVGEPERRFREDALRVMRGLRFSAVLGFDLEEETAAALVRCRELLRHIAVERLREELVKLLCGPQAAQVLRRWPQVVEVILPEIGPLVGFDQHNRHHCYDVWEHTLHVLDAVEPVPVLRCAALFHDMGKPECFALDEAGGGHFMGHPVVSRRIAEAIMTRLRFDNATRDQIALLVEWHDHRIQTQRGLRRALSQLGAENLHLLLALQRADNLGQAPAYQPRRQAELTELEKMLEQLLAEDACFSLRQLAVNGRDLLALGYQGTEVGRMLRWLLEQVVDGDLDNDRAALLDAARRNSGK